MIGLGAVQALIELLDEAADRGRLEQAVRRWAREHVGASEVMIEFGACEPCGGAALKEQATTAGGSVLIVEATSSESARLTISSSLSADRITDSLRRTLIVAGRLFGFALTRVRKTELTVEQPSPLGAAYGGDRRPFLGTSKHAQQIANIVPRLAQSDVSVLIVGETGVGKTFVARLIHEASPRAREPLRVVNCSAIPETLIESELFGHERGAFTGANTSRTGLLEAAGAGTVLLDEIGELSLRSQAKLLHVLEDRRFERIGSNRTIDLRARVLCATNRNLDDMVRAGQFRNDLLFRISVVRFEVPPLRERVEDLLDIANQTLEDAAQSASRPLVGFTPQAQEVILRYPWPGNVRELRNAIEHAIALGDGPLIGTEDFPSAIAPHPAQPSDQDLVRLPAPLAILERRAIDASLRATNGNRVRAAELLGVTRQTLYNKLKLHKV